MPWKYNSTIPVGGEEIQFSNTKIVNISGPRDMTRSGRVFALKYTPRVIPMPVHTPSPQVGASVCVPTTLVRAPNSSISKGTSGNSAEAAASKGKEVISEKEQVGNIIIAKEGQEFLNRLKEVISRFATSRVKLHQRSQSCHFCSVQKLTERIF